MIEIRSYLSFLALSVFRFVSNDDLDLRASVIG